MDEVPAVETVLAPVDGSEESEVAVEYAAAIAAEYDALVHAIYVVDPTEREPWGDEEGFEEVGGAFADAIEALATERGVRLTHSVAYGFSTERLTVHPGSVVLDAADQMDADFLVVPREFRDGSAEVLERAAEYVLLYASQPVLSV